MPPIRNRISGSTPTPPTTTVPARRYATDTIAPPVAPIVTIAPPVTKIPTTTTTTTPARRYATDTPTTGGVQLGPQVPDWAKIPGAKISKASPDVQLAKRDLNQAIAAAKRAGVSQENIDTAIENKEPNVGIKALVKILEFDVIPGKRKFEPIKKLVLPPLERFDTGRRAVLSTLKETGDELAVWLGTRPRGVDNNYLFGAGGFSFQDWKDQVAKTNIGYGDYVISPTGNKWIDRGIGFTGDVFLDPLILASAPAGVVRKGAVEAAEAGGRAATAATARTLAEEAARLATQKAVDPALAAGQRAAAQAAAEVATKKAAAAVAEDTAAKVAQEASEIAVKASQGTAARRVLGARTREETAQIAREVRDAAIRSGNTKVANILTDEVIGNIAVRGYSAIKGPVADVLGISNRMRIINPLSIVGVGPQKYLIPGSEYITNILGAAVSGIRVGGKSQLSQKNWLKFLPVISKGLTGTELGNRIVRNMTPYGEGGLFGTEDILRMRTALRSGQIFDTTTGFTRKVKPAEAADFVKLLSQDNAYRLFKNQAVAESQKLLSTVLADKGFFKYSHTISQLLETPAINLRLRNLTPITKEEISTILGREITAEELAYAVRLRKIADEFYERANFVHKRARVATGMPFDKIEPLPKNANWFPHTLSNKTAEAIQAGKVSDDVLEQIGFDRTFALAGSNPRSLKVGEFFFKHKLTQKDIDGGVRRLNQIANEQGFKGVFFETNAESAFVKYAASFSKDTSFSEWLLQMGRASQGEGSLAGKGFQDDIRQVKTKFETSVTKPSTMQGLENAITDVITPARVNILNQIPAARGELESVVLQMQDLIQDMATRSLNNKPLFRDNINQTMSDLEQRIRDLQRTVEVPFGYGAAITSEAQALLVSLQNESRNLILQVDSIKPSQWTRILPIYMDSAERFMQINASKYPGLLGSPEVRDMLQNVKRLEDPAFAAAMPKWLRAETQMFKAWVTATPGFHGRNALSNVFFMTSAGAQPANIIEATGFFKAYRKYLKSVRKGTNEETYLNMMEEQLASAWTAGDMSWEELQYFAREGAEGGHVQGGFVDFLDSPAFKTWAGVPSNYLPWNEFSKDWAKYFPKWEKASKEIWDTMNATATAGYGEVGSIFEGSARAGISGLENVKGTTRAAISRTLAKPLAWSKKTGNFVENWSRFALTFDGLRQGMTGEQAAARTAKYLFDYQDLSIADKNIKQFIPFATWTSRAFPLVVESMWINPQAYAVYNSAKRNLEDTEGGEGQFTPSFWKGAFKAPGTDRGYLMPDFGFQRQEESLGTITDPSKLLGSINPIVRAPFEAGLNKDFGTGKQIFNPKYDEGTKEQLAYIFKQVLPQSGAATKYINAVNGLIIQLPSSAVVDAVTSALQSPNIRKFTGGVISPGKPDFVLKKDGKYTREEARQFIFSFFGIPYRDLQPYQQTAVITEIIQKLNNQIARAKQAKEDKIKGK